MRKTILKLLVFFLTFLIALPIIGKIMNKDHSNMTVEMAAATLPVIVMEKDGFAYNRLNGYVMPMELSGQRDTITVLGSTRETAFTVNTYGRNVTGLSMEVRSVDGSRLVEQTDALEFEKDGQYVRGTLELKDLYEPDQEYGLTLMLELDSSQIIYYYTRVLWGQNLHLEDKLLFVQDFHERLFNREAAKSLTKYLETNGKLNDNSTFHKVDIHSSFKQVTYGDLEVTPIGNEDYKILDIDAQTASVSVEFLVFTRGEKDNTFYRVKENFRVRHSEQRMYLLNYERTMNQIPDVNDMYANNKILFGITDENLHMMESADGNVVVFQVAHKLCSYHITTNKLAVIYSFYDNTREDDRNLVSDHDIKILDVDESGSVRFAVYGYMNRGRYEGQVGICVYNYDSGVNTIEELIFIPYKKSFSVLKSQMEQLLYLNRDQKLYLYMDKVIYCVDLEKKTYQTVVKKEYDEQILVSENHKIMVWQQGEQYLGKILHVMDLTTDKSVQLACKSSEAVKALGFIGDDLIYGVARKEDISIAPSGNVTFPMYKLIICNSDGVQLKVYQPEQLYITECQIEDNQITLTRCSLNDDGVMTEASPDHIMNNEQTEQGKNIVVTAEIDVYERYVQLQVTNTIDERTLQILTPKEVVFEGNRNLSIESGEDLGECYYVYGGQGVSGIYISPGRAISEAWMQAGIVLNEKGEKIWYRGNTVAKNQIMAITEPEQTSTEDSLRVCLNTVLRLEGFGKDVSEEIELGKTGYEILRDNLTNARVLNLEGCEPEAMLYYLNKDVPVLAFVENNEAVLLTGFNEYNFVIFRPATGKLYKLGKNDTAKWMQDNGNCFIAYIRNE